MSALDQAPVGGTGGYPGRSVAPWAPLVHEWLPVWLLATGFELAAEEVRCASVAAVPGLVDALFVTMQDEVGAAIDTWIHPDDEITEPMAVLESSEYVLGSLPADWIDFVRSGRLAGRAALVAQMALFATLLQMAADPVPEVVHLAALAQASADALAVFDA